MFHGRTLNTKINDLHCRALRIIYRNYNLSFRELLVIDGSCTIHHTNIKRLAIEIFKCKNNLSPVFMKEIFNIRNVSHRTRSHNCFYSISNPKTSLMEFHLFLTLVPLFGIYYLKKSKTLIRSVFSRKS